MEVVDVEVGGGKGNRLLRVYIDHPDGVDHELCVRVTGVLQDYLREHTVEVSSPGLERRLRKPKHYRAAVGKKINVKTYGPVEGRRNFAGFLVAVDNRAIGLDVDGEEFSIPLDEIARAHTVFEFE